MSRKPYLLLLFWKKFSRNLVLGLSIFMLVIGVMAAKGSILSQGPDSAIAQLSDPVVGEEYPVIPDPIVGEEYQVLSDPIVGEETQVIPDPIVGNEYQVIPDPVVGNEYQVVYPPVQQPTYTQPAPSYYEGPGCNGTHAVWGKWDGNTLVTVIQDNGESSECGASTYTPSSPTTGYNPYSPTTGYNPYPSTTSQSSGYEGPGCNGSHSVWAVWDASGNITRIEADYGAQPGECNNPGTNAAGHTNPDYNTPYNPYPSSTSSSGTWEFKYPQCRGNQVVDVYQNTATGAYEERNPHYQEDACGNNQQWEGPGCQGNHSVWGIFSADGSRLISVEKDYGVKPGECNNPYTNTTTVVNTSTPVYTAQNVTYQDVQDCDGAVRVTRRYYTNGQTSIVSRQGQVAGYCGVGYTNVQQTNVYTGNQGTGAYYAPYQNTAYNPYAYNTAPYQGTGGYYAPYTNTAYNPYAYATAPYQGTGGYYAPTVNTAYNPYPTTPPPFQGVGGYYAPYPTSAPPPFQGVGGYYAPYPSTAPAPFQGTGGYYAPYPNAAPPPFQGVGGYYAPYPTVAYDPYAYGQPASTSTGAYIPPSQNATNVAYNPYPTTPPPFQGVGGYYAPYPTYTTSYQGMGGYYVPTTPQNSGSTTQPTVSNKTIIMRSMTFQPANITINAGDSITWANLDSSSHTATSDDNAWATQVLQNGQSATINFVNPGTYHYHCAIHPDMKGTITVLGPNGGSATTSSVSASSSATSNNPNMTAYSAAGAGTDKPQVVAQNPDGSITELPKTGVPLFAWAVSGLLPLGMKLRKGSKNDEIDGQSPQAAASGSTSANTLWIERELSKKA